MTSSWNSRYCGASSFRLDTLRASCTTLCGVISIDVIARDKDYGADGWPALQRLSYPTVSEGHSPSAVGVQHANVRNLWSETSAARLFPVSRNLAGRATTPFSCEVGGPVLICGRPPENAHGIVCRDLSARLN